MQSSNYAPEDVFWGELGGCLEAVDAGTTTLVDHAHINISPDHSRNPVTQYNEVLTNTIGSYERD